MKIIDKYWFTTLQGFICIVVAEDDMTAERKAYIGICKGDDEREDVRTVLVFGQQIHIDSVERIRQYLTKSASPAWIKIEGKVSTRTLKAVIRGYNGRHVSKPLDSLTDKELLSIKNLGEKSLAEIRAVIPAPNIP